MSRCWINLTISLLFSSFAFNVVKLKNYPYKKKMKIYPEAYLCYSNQRIDVYVIHLDF